MSILTPIPPRLPLYQRLLFQVPILGWIARDVAFGSPDNAWYAAAIAATAWILAVTTWGLVAFVLPFVIAAPLILLTLAVMAWG